MPFLAALAAAALLAAPPAPAAAPASAPAAARAKPAGRAAKAIHPDVGAQGDCAGCHQDTTPDAFAAWRQSKHGLALVKCFVCHGSTRADFARRPAASRCLGCHGEQVAALAAPAMKGKDCFACHPGHGLDPHASKDRTAAARLGADVELARERQAGPVNLPQKLPAALTPPAPPAAAPAPASAPTAPAATRQQPTAAAAPEKDLATAKPHPTTEKP